LSPKLPVLTEWGVKPLGLLSQSILQVIIICVAGDSSMENKRTLLHIYNIYTMIKNDKHYILIT